MELRDHFETTEHWLFRWRSYLPAVLLIPVGVVAIDYHFPLGDPAYQDVWEFACLAVSGVGLAIRIMVAGFVPGGTSGRNSKAQAASKLNTTGIYSVCRHPLYLGNFFVGLGWGLFFLNGWLVAFYIMAFCLYYERIMLTEEGYLREKFGTQFKDWSAITPAFFPSCRLWKPNALPFSWRTAILREYLTTVGIVLMFFLLELAEHAAGEHRIFFDPFWSWLSGIALLGFVVLRVLKKRTAALHVSGR